MTSCEAFLPGPTPDTVQAADGSIREVPAGWVLVPPGDAARTRRVKAAGEHWAVQEKKGRRTFSRGVWVAAEIVERVDAELEAERATLQYAKRRQADAVRRHVAQTTYVENFYGAVLRYLDFHPTHQESAERLAKAIADHATPVGSGTVARTKRIPIEQRAEAAVIAWMRHQTTGYDSMIIARVKGKRREVRRKLARRSQELLEAYRRGDSPPAKCPLRKALSKLEEASRMAAGDDIGVF